MTTEGSAHHVIPIQMLRAIAAIMVVFVHIDTQLVRLNRQSLGVDWLSSGVDIFFVISGFIMWTSVERRPEISATEFLKNRCIRILPLYWLTTIFVVLVAVVAPHTLRTAQLEPLHVIASFLFLPARHPTAGVFWPLVVPGWSLNYEMLFYVVFALALAIGRGRKARFLTISAAILAVLAAGQATQSTVDVAHFYANPVLIEFVLGMALGAIWSSGRIRANYAFMLVLIGGFFVLWPGSNLGWLPVPYIASTMIVGGAIFLPRVRKNPLSQLGDASYSLYLTHTIVLSALAFTCQALAFRPSDLGFITASLACAIAVALAVHSYFERPVTVRIKKAFLNRQAAKCSEENTGARHSVEKSSQCHFLRRSDG